MKWHLKVYSTLSPGTSRTFASGLYDEPELAIDVQRVDVFHGENCSQPLLFENPLIDETRVSEVHWEKGNINGGWFASGNHQHPRFHEFGVVGGHHLFWDDSFRVTRHPDTEKYKEYTETIYYKAFTRTVFDDACYHGVHPG